MPSPTPHERSILAKSLAREAGFDLVGIARAAPSAHPDAYQSWIANNHHGAMHYLAKDLDQRLDITQKFPWAQSLLCVALAYFQPAPQPPEPPHEPAAKIARYAWGRDYHKVIEAKLHRMEKRLREELALPPEQLEIRSYCDTGPILEREFAASAGLGWTGKNTLLIHPRHGSWFLLGEMILNLELEPDSPLPDHCGTCRRCIDACPTQAITPYSVDATRCISYLTLENRGPIAEEFHAPMREANFIAGCDICQEVCPFNRQPLLATEPDLAPKAPAPAVNLEEIIRWSDQEWDILTRGRAFRRAKHAMWQRNAEILAQPNP